MSTDKYYMEICVKIAESNIDPVGNKSIGCILVKNGEIIAEGCRHTFHNMGPSYTHKTIHGEHMALMEAGEKARGGTLYTTLEPCTKRWHNSITKPFPPCTTLISTYGISRVVIGSIDESFGRGGVKTLESCGIQVDFCRDFEDRIKKINENSNIHPMVQKEFEEFSRKFNESL